MIREIIQYVYNKDKEPSINDVNNAISGLIKIDDESKKFVYEIGIQTLPGVKVDINRQSIIIGRTGIFNLNVENYGSVSSIKLNADNPLFDSDTFYLIVDIMVEKEVKQ